MQSSMHYSLIKYIYVYIKESLDGGKLDEVLGKVELGEDDRQEMINVVKNHFNGKLWYGGILLNHCVQFDTLF